MKVYIGKHKRYFGPYQLAELLCFWAKKTRDEYGIEDKPDWVYDFGEFLAHGNIEPEPKVGERSKFMADRKDTWLAKFLSWINSKKTRKISVKIDRYDLWGMDHTLALIILPMLKQLRDNKQGTPLVDDDDVPDHLKSTNAPPKEHEWDVDDNNSLRWDYVVDEMIFAFECKVDTSWEDQFHSGEFDYEFIKQEDGNYLMVKGENHTHKYDLEGMTQFQERISNGFRLFGRYFESLWC
jgi:hypothetical protein